ncbi:hypothetical protein SV7mr_21070 [Stieleria bergensis]|uniref:Peptidase family M50 n=1 Tax=Stieleria bergensis TaxID=2528025 RepID=A0A517STZ8_9BACT|nr:hypothetical protein SV7mr_21070 [Planctomycetes bacterium SV_7m_r]
MPARWTTFAGLLVVSYCVMTFTHELGHLIGGCCGGGKLLSADLAPWRLPYSLFRPDPFPKLTLWSGPILGVLIPLLIAWPLGKPWAWLIAHFCVLANGCYLAIAAFTGDPLLDTARLLNSGVHPLLIAAFCVITIPCGYLGFRRSCIEWLSPPTPER